MAGQRRGAGGSRGKKEIKLKICAFQWGLLGMSQLFYAGFVLTACVAGAELSSYASFLSKGDVALTILLTSSTTIASVLVTPLLTGLLIGSVVPVDAVAMSKSILQVVNCLDQLGVCSSNGFVIIWSFLAGCSCSGHSWSCSQHMQNRL